MVASCKSCSLHSLGCSKRRSEREKNAPWRVCALALLWVALPRFFSFLNSFKRQLKIHRCSRLFRYFGTVSLPYRLSCPAFLVLYIFENISLYSVDVCRKKNNIANSQSHDKKRYPFFLKKKMKNKKKKVSSIGTFIAGRGFSSFEKNLDI